MGNKFPQSTEDKIINRVAAMMAVSNYGFAVDVNRVLRWELPTRYDNSPRSEVCDLAGHLIESDEHEEMFADEAFGWRKEIIKAGGLSKFAAVYRHHADTIGKLIEAHNG